MLEFQISVLMSVSIDATAFHASVSGMFVSSTTLKELDDEFSYDLPQLVGQRARMLCERLAG